MINKSINYTRPFLYEYQKAILNSEQRFTVTEASTKVGKTASHIIWLFEQALKLKNNQSVWWVAPVYSQAEIAFNRMRSQVNDRDFFKANETKLKLTLPTGGIIQFKSAEKPDNLYGDDVYAAVFDEFTRAREEAWYALRSTLTATNGQCKFIGNVKGKKNWGYRLAQRAKQGEQNFEHFKITAYDAAREGLLSMEEIEQAKRDLPEGVFRELYLAEAAEDGSNPFGISYINQCCYPLSSYPAVCYGIDLAKSSDYTVIIGLDKNGAVCHFERFQKDWRQTTQTILELPPALIAIDSTGVGDPIGEDIARVREVELFKFSSSSKQQIMEGLALAIQQRKITFPEGSIKDELEQFEFEFTRTGVKYSAPAGLHDDCVCSLALAWHKYRSGAMYSGQYHII
jgi:phage FluMu gp28-like protein